MGRARIDHGRALVAAPARGRDDAVGDAHDVLVVWKGCLGPPELALALDVDLLGAVDHDLRDTLVVEQGLDGPKAQDVGDDLLEQTHAVGAGQLRALRVEDRVEELLDLLAHLVRLREVDVGANLGDQFVLHARAQLGELIRVALYRPAERGDAVEVARGAAALGLIGPAARRRCGRLHSGRAERCPPHGGNRCRGTGLDVAGRVNAFNPLQQGHAELLLAFCDQRTAGRVSSMMNRRDLHSNPPFRLVHVGRDILAKDGGRRGTAGPVVCPPRTHCALRALLPHPPVRAWWSSGSAAWGPRAVAGRPRPPMYLRHAVLVTDRGVLRATQLA